MLLVVCLGLEILSSQSKPKRVITLGLWIVHQVWVVYNNLDYLIGRPITTYDQHCVVFCILDRSLLWPLLKWFVVVDFTRKENIQIIFIITRAQCTFSETILGTFYFSTYVLLSLRNPSYIKPPHTEIIPSYFGLITTPISPTFNLSYLTHVLIGTSPSSKVHLFSMV